MNAEVFASRRGSTSSKESLPTDERQTPRWFFRLCDRIWGPIDLDCFAADWNHQVARYITKEQDFFRSKLKAKCAWVQPPYSRGFLMRSLSEARARVLSGQYQRAVCLHPVDPSSKWWLRNVARPEGKPLEMRSLWNVFPAPLTNSYQLVSERLVITTAFPSARIAFRSPTGPCGGDPDNPRDTGAMQPSAVVVFDRSAVRRAA